MLTMATKTAKPSKKAAVPAAGKAGVSASRPPEKLTTPPKTRLNSFNGLRVHLEWAIRELEQDRLTPQVVNALTAAINALAGILKDHDLDARVKRLEEGTNADT
jgi:hypothetical protein